MSKFGTQRIVLALERSNFTLCELDGVAGADPLMERNKLLVRQRRLRVIDFGVVLAAGGWRGVGA
jgi:hypothetical protein